MKIEANPSSKVPLPKTVKPSAEVTPKVSVKSTENSVNKQLSQKRIVRWFSQVGINTSYGSIKNPTLDEKIRRKEKLLAQRKLANLENILGRALDFCLEDGREESLDPDWFFSFVKMAEEIFSPPMQELWGKIFAVETARPGSFSLKTLTVLKQLTQRDAHIFRHAVSLASQKRGEATPRLVIGYYQKSNLWSLFNSHKKQQLNLAEYGLSYPDLLSLMDLGLIHHSEIESGELAVNTPVDWRCAGQNLSIAAKRAGTTLLYYKFTTTGAELCKLVNRKKHETYVSAMSSALRFAFYIDEQ